MNTNDILEREQRRKEKKKEYNRRYLEGLKKKAIEEATINNTEEDKEEKEEVFFLPDKSKEKTTQQPPLQTVQYQPMPVQTSLKQKCIETLVLSSIGLIPMALKCIITNIHFKKSSSTKPENTQPEATTTFTPYAPQMNLL